MKQRKATSSEKTTEPRIPLDLRHALESSSSIKALWMDITPIARRDWMSWIDAAKQPETRKRRIEQTLSKLAAGKRRPCCYAVVPLKLYKALELAPKAKTQWRSLTPDARRDFIDWIDSAKEPEMHKLRIEKACALLAAGKRHP